MELSSSWEAANCAAARELPSILRNPEVHHRVHISLPPVPILSQIDPIPTIPSYLYKIHFNIVHPSTSWSSQWSLSFWLSHQNPICIPVTSKTDFILHGLSPPMKPLQLPSGWEPLFWTQFFQKYINESELLTKALVFWILVAKWSAHRDAKHTHTHTAYTGRMFHKSWWNS
jgi:hypothetical protein